MSIQLSSEWESFVRDRVADGRYSDEADVIRTAFSLLECREQLLAQIDEGTAQLRSGEYTEYSDYQLPQFIAAVEAASRRNRGPDQQQ